MATGRLQRRTSAVWKKKTRERDSVSEILLDASVLIALLWRSHESHAQVQRWFSRNSRAGWATCAVTEAAFVRIVSNPAFSAAAVSPEEGTDLLEANLGHPRHRYWPDQHGFIEAVRRVKSPLEGYRQVTDAYLLGLTLRQKGRLATLDGGIAGLIPEGTRHDIVEVIGRS